MSVNKKMTALADEIRELSGTTDTKSLDEMKVDVDAANAEIAEQADLITQIQAALEGKTADETALPTLSNPAVASDILSSKEAIDGSGNKITGTIATKTSSDLTSNGSTITVPAGYYASVATKSVSATTQATPSITVDGFGKITASATQSAGYVASGTKSATKQLTVRAGTTITPGTSDITAVKSGYYATGSVYVKGDANLKAENIASGVSIFGVTGTHNGAEDLNTELTEQENLISQLSTILDSKASGSSGGSVETCTVIFTCFSSIDGYAYTAYENNEITAKGQFIEAVNNNPTSITFSNVVCGSAIYVFHDYIMNGMRVGGGVESITSITVNGGVCRAPLIAGAVGTIDIYDDD